MKKEYVYLLAGIGIGYLIFSKLKDKEELEIIRLGDKSKDVLTLQKLINKAEKEKVEETGMYDKGTKKAVNELLKDTGVLMDEEVGALDKKFVEANAKLFKINEN